MQPTRLYHENICLELLELQKLHLHAQLETETPCSTS